MRGHIIRLPQGLILLGITIMGVPVVLMMQKFTSPPLPGEAIPDSIAVMLRGGGCAHKTQFTCPNDTGDCNGGSGSNCKETAKLYRFETAAKEDQGTGTKYCCGGAAECTQWSNNYMGCTTTAPSP